MPSKAQPATARVQVYLTDPQVVAALTREARSAKEALSKAAGRAIARGLKRSVSADPQDRLLVLERRLNDHMRATSRDLQIIEELQIEIARALFLRLPDSCADEDPTVQAAVERRIDRLLDHAAARIVAGKSKKEAENEPGAGLQAAE